MADVSVSAPNKPYRSISNNHAGKLENNNIKNYLPTEFLAIKPKKALHKKQFSGLFTSRQRS